MCTLPPPASSVTPPTLRTAPDAATHAPVQRKRDAASARRSRAGSASCGGDEPGGGGGAAANATTAAVDGGGVGNGSPARAMTYPGAPSSPAAALGGRGAALLLEDPEYGSPTVGTKTYERGQRAHAHVAEEMCVLCEVIESCLQPSGADGPRAWAGRDAFANEALILFGDLFERYRDISDKVRAARPYLVTAPSRCVLTMRADKVCVRRSATTRAVAAVACLRMPTASGWAVPHQP
jgi:hypothetical protein